MSKPAAETQLPVSLVGDLIRDQHPAFAHLAITAGTSGWDNDIFRLGEGLAVRLPLPIPAAVRVGKPQAGYPWKWSITPWFAGQTLDQSPIGSDQVEVLVSFLQALHTPAPADAPHNPWRSVPLAQSQPSFDMCAAALAGGEHEVDGELLRLWELATHVAPDAAPTWIHGDLHPRNV